YASALDLADDLRRFLDGAPIAARPVTPLERAVKWARRRPAVASLLLLSAVLALTGVALGTWQWGRAEQKADEAQQARRAAEEELSRTATALYANQVAQAQRALRDLDLGEAERLLNACRPDRRHWEHHYLSSLLRRRLRTLPGHTAAARCVAF